MLVTLKEALNDARARKFALPAFNCTEDVMVRTILETAEMLKAPVILMCLDMHLKGNGWKYLADLIRMVADYHKIPIVLHLDHAYDPGLIKAAVDNGFTSVMIDGSKLPFDENVAVTKSIVDVAHPRGVSVEGELGHVGGMDLQDVECAESVLTKPDEVEKFVEQTDVDALAISIGTAHGVYRSLPNLNIERLKQLNAVSTVPLVLHGGSGTPDEQIRAAVAGGICKLNVFADLRLAMFRGLRKSAEQTREDPLPQQLFGPVREQLAAIVTEKIKLLGADNRA